MRPLAVLCLVAVPALAQSPERYRHSYDVRYLTRPVQDFRGPGLDDDFEGGDLEHREPISGEFLQDAIKRNFDEDSWSDERNTMEYRDGVLHVTQSEENHKRIAAYLEMLRRRISRRILVEADVLQLTPAAWAAAGAAPGILTAEQEKALRDAAADPAKGAATALLRAVGTNGQRVYAADVRRQSYVRDFDVEIAEDEAIADPVTGELRTGSVLDVRGLLSPDAATVLLETRFAHARLRDLKSFDTGASVLGSIQMPSRDGLRAKCTLACPVGRTVLLAAGHAGGDRVTVVLVRPTLAGEAAGDATASTEKRQVRMFDVATLTATVPDFAGPRVGLYQQAEAGATTAVFDAPMDEGLGIDLETLTAMVKDNVARDSWNNRRNSIWTTGDQIAVLQTPEVLDEIGKFLAEATPQRARMISVEATIVALDEAGWLSRRAELSGASPAEAAIRGLLDAAARRDGARVAAAGGAVGLSAQRFYCWAGGDFSWLYDHDVEIAQGASSSDPIIGQSRTGIVLDVRPTLAGDDRRISLDLRPGFAAFPEPETFDTKVASVGRLQKVRDTMMELRGQLLVSENTWSLAGVGSQRDGGRHDILVLLVRARSLEAK